MILKFNEGNSFLQVNFLTDKLNPFNAFGNGYSLRFKPDTVSLYRHINGGRSTNLVGSDVSINRNTLGNRARLSIRVDREKKSIALFINDKFIKHWDDAQSDPLPVKSNGLSFTSAGVKSHLTLSRISLKNGLVIHSAEIMVQNNKAIRISFFWTMEID